MTKSKKPVGTFSVIPKRNRSKFDRDLVRLLGEPALLGHDDQSAYIALEKSLIEAVKPKDAIELIFVRDVADLTWEIQRLKLARVHLIDHNLHEGLTRFLSEDLKGDVPAFLASLKWRNGHPAVSREVRRFLKSAGITRDMIVSETIRRLMDEYEGFNIAIARLEARRNALLYEVDRHRHVLAFLLKEEIGVIEADPETSRLPRDEDGASA